MAKRLYTYDDIMNLPDFIRVELIDGVICTDDWTNLEIDEEVFQNPPSEDHHVTYRLSIVKNKTIPDIYYSICIGGFYEPFNKIKSVFNSSSDDVPDAQTIYFKNGEMYKVYPTDKESWYDARYLVSDGVKYDLENLDDLKRIPVPKFPAHQNIMEGYGVTGNLDYVLRMKAGSFYNRKDKIMCSACLWKCTELMLAHPLSWEESHFYRIVQWHVEMGMFDEADKAEKYIYSVLDYDANYQQLINHIKDNPEYIKQQEAFHKKNLMRKEYYHIFMNYLNWLPNLLVLIAE